MTFQAAVRGVLDLRGAKPFDPLWRAGWRLLLDVIEEDNLIRWTETLHQHNTAILQVPYLSEDAWKQACSGARKNSNAIERLLFPYVKREEKERDMVGFREMYVGMFGDWVNDPVAKANYERLLRFLEKRNADGLAAQARMQGRTRRLR